jgi:hypothetical protein
LILLLSEEAYFFLRPFAGAVLLGGGKGLLQADHVFAGAKGVEGLRFLLELFLVVVRRLDREAARGEPVEPMRRSVLSTLMTRASMSWPTFRWSLILSTRSSLICEM